MRKTVKLAVAAAAAAAAVAAWFAWADYAATSIARLVAFAVVPFGIAVIPVVLVVVGAVVAFHGDQVARDASRRTYFGASPEQDDEVAKRALARKRGVALRAVGGVVIAAGLVAIYPAARTVNRYGYEAEHAIAQAAVVEVDDVQPGYEPRTPYPVAVARIDRSLAADGESNPPSPSDPTYMVVDDEGRWCSYLRPNAQTWRRPLTGVVCVTDAGTVIRADFDGQLPSDRAMFRLKLERAVSHHARGATVTESDTYGAIDADGEPMLVVPLKRPSGTVHAFDVPAGVLVYDTHGTATFHRDVEPGEIPGPVVGMSIAQDVRQSLNARGTFKQYFQHKLELQDTTTRTSEEDGEGVDALDPNAMNPTEFHLRNAESGRMEFVTPLTPYGRSSNVVAMSVVAADEVHAGQLPTLELFKLPKRSDGQPRLTNGDVVARIVTRYGLTIPFADANENQDAAQKFRVMEIIPGADPETWTATVGLPTRPVYTIEMDRVDGASCVYTYEDHTELRCDAADVVTVPQGALTGVAANTDTPKGTGADQPTGSSGDLDAMTVDELIAARDRIQRELDDRARTAGP